MIIGTIEYNGWKATTNLFGSTYQDISAFWWGFGVSSNATTVYTVYDGTWGRISTDYGHTWYDTTPTAGAPRSSMVDMSGDGTKLVLCCGNGYPGVAAPQSKGFIYTGIPVGGTNVTWTPTTATYDTRATVAISADGSTIASVVTAGPAVFTTGATLDISKDNGRTWWSVTLPGVSINADKVAMSSNGRIIYVSCQGTDAGASGGNIFKVVLTYY